MAKEEENKPFKIPESLFHQINEFSGGGFLLFILNENNEMVPYLHCDDDAIGTHLLHTSKLYIEAREELLKDSIKNSLMEICDDGEEEEEEDDYGAGEF